MIRTPRSVALAMVVAGVLTATAASSAVAGKPSGKKAKPTVIGHVAPRGTAQLLAVSCGSSTHCWATGTAAPSTPSAGAAAAIVATVNGGTSWTSQIVPFTGAATLSAISCSDAKHCMAVGTESSPQLAGAVATTADGGRLWVAASVPTGAVDLVGVSCSAALHCLVLATDGSSFWSATSADGGATWQRGGTLPAGFAGASGLECPTATTCVTAGYVPTGPGHGNGAIETTGNGGVAWLAATVPSGTGLLHDVSCPTATQCLAVGTASTTDTDIAPAKGTVLSGPPTAVTGGPSSFVALGIPTGLDDGFGISCPASGVCAAVGTAWTADTPPTPAAGVVTTLNGGQQWHAPLTQYVPRGLAAVDCPTAQSCVAVGGDVSAHITLPAPARAGRSTTGTGGTGSSTTSPAALPKGRR